jgi:hypothetical protein
MYDSRRASKAAGRGGARYLVLYSLMPAPAERLGTGELKKKKLL